MKKTAFKTFVYSFVFSLFAILLTNRVYFRTLKTENNDIKISGKNITLFLKDKELAPIRLASLPTKKIVLSTIADISPKEEVLTNTLKTTIPDSKIEEMESVSLDVAENSVVPESYVDATLPIPVLKKEENILPVSKTILATADLPMENKAKPQEDVIQQTSNTKTNLAQNPTAKNDIALTVKIPLEQTKTKKIADSKSLPIQPTDKEEILHTTTDNLKSKEIKTAQMSAPSTTQESSPQILIPLESSQKQVWAKAEIKTAADANKNQVALNAKNIPISSMEAQTAKTSSSNSESTKKTWKSMKEKYGAKKDDDPWVVAKGKKFPDNQLLLEDKKYKISDEDVQKIFDAGKNTLANRDENNLQLAAKTVKNLLIPIPEDILNDENLTPQLISSPKNKEIKEELEAKGLIRKEEPEEEVKPETTALTAASDDESKSSKDGSILDSLTSLFAGNKNEAPEIGIIEDDEEETNSLFSAFTRKQSRLMSKILPTEIRLSFQPNRAEISGQTLKWIKAFAQKTAEEPTTGLEIRIDGTSSPLLQRRRLNLLQNILLNEGATPEKINTVFTAREPNSFILRTVRVNKETINTPAKNNNRYMQW